MSITTNITNDIHGFILVNIIITEGNESFKHIIEINDANPRQIRFNKKEFEKAVLSENEFKTYKFCADDESDNPNEYSYLEISVKKAQYITIKSYYDGDIVLSKLQIKKDDISKKELIKLVCNIVDYLMLGFDQWYKKCMELFD
jgi:hypothetical protein